MENGDGAGEWATENRDAVGNGDCEGNSPLDGRVPVGGARAKEPFPPGGVGENRVAMDLGSNGNSAGVAGEVALRRVLQRAMTSPTGSSPESENVPASRVVVKAVTPSCVSSVTGSSGSLHAERTIVNLRRAAIFDAGECWRRVR